MPEEALRILSKISDKDCALLGLRPEISRPENMIIINLTVAPPPVRPIVIMSSFNRSEDDLTYSYQKIIQTNNQLLLQLNRGANSSTQANIRLELQYYVATLMDNEI
jgi:DNA-directed RNA polymerase beta' subunit